MWFAYFSGAFLALMYKLGVYLYTAPDHSNTRKQALAEWFLSPTTENKTSWISTIGIVWMFGGWYMGAWGWSDDPTPTLPQHPSIAFTIGTLMEFIAPAISKWMVGFAVERFTGSAK